MQQSANRYFEIAKQLGHSERECSSSHRIKFATSITTFLSISFAQNCSDLKMLRQLNKNHKQVHQQLRKALLFVGDFNSIILLNPPINSNNSIILFARNASLARMTVFSPLKETNDGGILFDCQHELN